VRDVYDRPCLVNRIRSPPKVYGRLGLRNLRFKYSELEETKRGKRGRRKMKVTEVPEEEGDER